MIRFNRLTALSLTTALLLFVQPTAQAVNRVSNQANGDWNINTHWTPAPGVAPSSADTLGIGNTAGGGVSPSIMTIGSGNAQSNRLYIGGGNVLGGSAGTGTLNVNGGSNLWASEYLYLGGDGTGGTNNGSLNVNGGSTMNILNNIWAARFSTNGVANITLNNGKLNNLTAADNMYLSSDPTGTRANVTLTNGSIFNIGNSGGGTSGSLFIGGNNTDSYATISISANSRLNLGLNPSLFIRGGNPLDATVINGTTGFARYTLPLSNTMSDGHFSQSRSIVLADQTNKVELTLDSTLAAGQASAAALHQFGTLQMARATNANAVLNLNSMNVSFYGGTMHIANEQGTQNQQARINLTNSTLRNMGGGLELGIGTTTTKGILDLTGGTSRMIVRDSLTIGRSGDDEGTADILLGSNGQLNLLNGSIIVRGGNNGVNKTYNWGLYNTPTNGKISFDRSLSVGDASESKVTLMIDSATSASTLNQWGTLNLGRFNNSTSTLDVNGVNINFRGGAMNIANEQGNNNQQGTLKLTNSTIRNTAGG
ncbi:MAG: hypothetical protein K8T91_07315, partial [Planctomycetes bacterium]|nr:hypothetical protein [Planctomycetota bacterium]